MKKLFLRPVAFLLSTIGLFFGFTSKVLAQYGAPEMHFRVLGKVHSLECDQPIGGIEVSLVNDATGQVSKVFTDKDGNFNFRISEYYWEYKYTMNLSDIDGNLNQGTFLSKTVQFTLHSQTNGVHLGYNYRQNENTAMKIELDYDGQNPCVPVPEPENDIEPLQQAIREEDAHDSISESPKVWNPDLLPDQNFISDAVVYPNPNNGQFTIGFTLHQSVETTVQIFSLTGQLIDKFHVALEQGKQQIPVHLNSMPSQTVIVRITAGNEHFDFKVVLNDF